MRPVVQTYDFFRNYDTSSAGYTYGRYARQFQNVERGSATAESSTTVTDGTTGDNVFRGLGVGDVLYNKATGDLTNITAKADDTSVTVADTVTWTTAALTYRKFFSGTTADDGWIDVSHLKNKTVFLQIDTFASTSISFAIETKSASSAPSTTITTITKTAVTVDTQGVNSIAPVVLSEAVAKIRVGVKTDTRTATQSVSVSIVGELR